MKAFAFLAVLFCATMAQAEWVEIFGFEQGQPAGGLVIYSQDEDAPAWQFTRIELRYRGELIVSSGDPYARFCSVYQYLDPNLDYTLLIWSRQPYAVPQFEPEAWGVFIGEEYAMDERLHELPFQDIADLRRKVA